MTALEALKNGAYWNGKIYGGKVKSVYLEGAKYVISQDEIKELEATKEELKAKKLADTNASNKADCIKEEAIGSRAFYAAIGWDEFVRPNDAEKTAAFASINLKLAEKNNVQIKDCIKDFVFGQVYLNNNFVHAFVISNSQGEVDWRHEWRGSDLEEVLSVANEFGVKDVPTKKLNRSEIFKAAHKIAKQTRNNFKSYKEALSVALKKAYADAK